MASKLTQQGRYRRRVRAARACERCRGRKVRCDIVHRIGSCTNCELDQVLCIDDSRTRGSARERDDDQVGSNNSPSTTTTHMLPPACNLANEHQLPPQANEYPKNLFLAETLAGTLSHPTTDLSSRTVEDTITVRTAALATPALSQLSTHFDGTMPNTRESSSFIPNFVTKPPPDLEPQEISYLLSRGVFELPPVSMIHVILRCFINYVYPLLPIVDLSEILDAIVSDGQSRQVSLPLLYGIMLAGAAFLDHESVCKTGYQTHFTLRSSLGRKLTLLYNVDYEPDRLITIQSLLLMTYFHDKTDDSKHLMHKILNAKHLALTIGLNKDLGQGKIDPRKRKLWKRVWWCCYIRDRTCALGVRQYPIISAGECQWEILTLEDFDITSDRGIANVAFGDCYLLFNTSIQASLAEVCIAQLELWRLLEDILRTRYKVAFPKYGVSTETTLILMPSPPQANRTSIKDCQRSLDQFFSQLPEQYSYRLPVSPIFEQSDRLLKLQCCILNLLYNSLQCALNRWALSPSSQSHLTSDNQSRQKARGSANIILSIFEYLHDEDMVQYTPGWAVTILMQAALTFKTELRVSQSQAGRRLQDCVDILEWLKSCHFHANFGISLIKAFLHGTGSATTMRENPSLTTVATEVTDSVAADTPNDVYERSSTQILSRPGQESRSPGQDTEIESLWFADYLEQEFWPDISPFEAVDPEDSSFTRSRSIH